jgi:protein-tyrosine-phosphatase
MKPSINDTEARAPTRLSILFVCSGNTCRSVIAEALARRHFGDGVRVESAGLRPQRPADARAAIDTLRDLYGIDASNHVPRSVAAVAIAEFSHVVAMDSNVAKALYPLADGELVVWNIDDPWDDPTRYHACARAIDESVAGLHRLVSESA